jgi:hypothetical protein
MCNATIIEDVATSESDYPNTILHKGQHIDDLVSLDIDKNTGTAKLCRYRSYCYPAQAFRLSGCTIEPIDGPAYGLSYGLEGARAGHSTADLRYNDVTAKLMSMGLCSACAQGSAEFYIKKPRSICGRLVKMALEGNPIAEAKLQGDPDYCNYTYSTH